MVLGNIYLIVIFLMVLLFTYIFQGPSFLRVNKVGIIHKLRLCLIHAFLRVPLPTVGKVGSWEPRIRLMACWMPLIDGKSLGSSLGVMS